MHNQKRLLSFCLDSPSTPSQLKYLGEDLDRYFILMENPTFIQKLWVVLTTQGIWSLITYRLGRWVRIDLDLPFVGLVLKGITYLAHFIVMVVTKIEISLDVNIGGGLYIGHAGYIVINPHAVLGTNCNISCGVVIGEGGREGMRGSPVIGNRVYIAPGAKLFGPITIGDGVAIGANAVVNDSVPENAVVAGVPAKIISYKGSGDFIIVRSLD